MIRVFVRTVDGAIAGALLTVGAFGEDETLLGRGRKRFDADLIHETGVCWGSWGVLWPAEKPFL